MKTSQYIMINEQSQGMENTAHTLKKNSWHGTDVDNSENLHITIVLDQFQPKLQQTA